MPFHRFFSAGFAALLSTTVLTSCIAPQDGGSIDSDTEEDTSLDYIWQHDTYIKASDAAGSDRFGVDTDTDGTTLVVGAESFIYYNNLQPVEPEISGSIYVFTRSGDSWVEEAIIENPTANDASPIPHFGAKVAVSGDTIAVAGRNGDYRPEIPVVWVYRKIGTTWSLEQTLEAHPGANGSDFGTDIDIDGDTLIVSAPRESSEELAIINSSDAPTYGEGTFGGAYVFTRTGSVWSQQSYLKPPFDTGYNPPRFGSSVSIDGDRVVFGAPRLALNEYGVFGPDTDFDALMPTSLSDYGSGAAITFTRSGTSWSLENVISFDVSDDTTTDVPSYSRGFADHVKLKDDVLLVSATNDYFGTNTITQGDDLSSLSPGTVNSGGVYLYRLQNSQWSLDAHFRASNPTGGDDYGASVDMFGDRIVIGAPNEDALYTGVKNGAGVADNSNKNNDTGAAYIVELIDGEWTQIAYLKSPFNHPVIAAASSVAFFDADTVAVTVPYDQVNLPGINKGQSFDVPSGELSSGGMSVYNRIANPSSDTIPPVTTTSISVGAFNTSNAPTSTKLNCSDSGADVASCSATYYTTDGSKPVAGEGTTQEYTADADIVLNQSGTTELKAYSIDAAGNEEFVKTFTFTFDTDLPTSIANSSAGSYSEPQSVSFQCEDASSACSVYYTLDGSDPSETSNEFSGEPVIIVQNATLKFMAIDDAGNAEDTINSLAYVIDLDSPVTSASPAGGTYNTAQSVTLSCTDEGVGCDATYYTTDGSDPTTSSAQYTAPIAISASTTLKFFSTDTVGNNEAINTAEYLIDTVAPTSDVSPAAGTYGPSVDVSLSCTDAISDCSVYYTTDGSAPTSASTEFTGAFTVSADTTVRYIAIDAVGNESSIAQAAYVIDTTAPTSSANVTTGSYSSDQNVSLTCTDASGSCSIYFTTDGSDPTSGSTLYSSAISITASTTLKFFSFDEYGNEESVNTETYVIDKVAPTASTTTVSDTYTEEQSVVLSCSDDVSICAVYYTTDGSDPTTGSTQYTGPIAVSSTTTLKFMAIDVAGNESSIQQVSLTFAGMIGDVVDVAADGNATAALKADGTVSVWGNNLYGVLGHSPGTNGDTLDGDVSSVIYSAFNPAASTVAGLTNVVKVAMGNNFAIALKDDGTVWAWGRNEESELGHEPGTNGDVAIETGDSWLFDVDGDGAEWVNTTPVQISGLTSIVDIAAGYTHALAVSSTGAVSAWGTNISGELGDNTTDSTFTPVQVTDTAGTGVLANAIAVAAGGSSSMAITSDGTLYGWGANNANQLGLSNLNGYQTPQQVLVNVDDAAVSSFSAVVLRQDGTVYHMGDVYNGIVDGGGSPVAGYTTPTQVAGLSGMVEVTTNDATTFATDSDGFTYVWGRNGYAQAGVNSTTGVTSPTAVSVGSASFVEIAKGGLHTAGLTEDGTLHMWGWSDLGQLGHAPNSNGDSLNSDFGAYYNQAGVTLGTVSARAVAAPSAVSASDAGNGELAVSWTAVAGATAYDVYYSRQPGVTAANGTVVANHTSGASFSVSATGGRYYVIVVAKDGSGNQSVSSLEAAVNIAVPEL